MHYFILFSAVLLGLSNLGQCAPLIMPSWFKTCKEDTVDMHGCILEKAKIVLPHLIKGNKEFKVPSLMPFRAKEITVQSGQNLKLKLLDVSMYGLESAEMTEVDLRLDEHWVSNTLIFKEIKVEGTYDIDGQILILPIKGHGPANFTFTNVVINVLVKWDVSERDNMHYMDVKSIEIKYEVGNAVFLLKELFNGDKRLGDEMNKFLNVNWRDFSNDISPAISNMIESVCVRIIGKVSQLMSIEQMFPK